MPWTTDIEQTEHQIAAGNEFNGGLPNGTEFIRRNRLMYLGCTEGGRIDIVGRTWPMVVSQIEINFGTVAVPFVLAIEDGVNSTTIIANTFTAWVNTDDFTLPIGKYITLVTTGAAQAMELAFTARRASVGQLG